MEAIAWNTELGRFQFSLWQMLTWTTVLAIILSSFHYVPESLRPGLPLRPDLAKLAVSLAGVALALIWLAFGRGRLVTRVVLLVAIMIGTPVWHSMNEPWGLWVCFSPSTIGAGRMDDRFAGDSQAGGIPVDVAMRRGGRHTECAAYVTASPRRRALPPSGGLSSSAVIR